MLLRFMEPIAVFRCLQGRTVIYLLIRKNVTDIYPACAIIPQLNLWHELVILHYLSVEDSITVGEIVLEELTRK